MYELMSQVTECISAAVIDHHGLIIDYYGDGLAAMWNAPADQSDHPELACRAALQMLQSLSGVSSDWAGMIERDLQLGIGLHTGLTHVGNTGTRWRAKYGPRGRNVNLASRVESAAKRLGLPLLATESTARRLSNLFAVHRLCRARMPNFSRPVDLYDVRLATSDANLQTAWQRYDEALDQFEQGNLQKAIDLLATIDAGANDPPSRFLIDHVRGELTRQHRRRSTDKTTAMSRGVISLSTT
jgi:adenylate cyclase